MECFEMKITVRHLVIATAWALSMAGPSAHAAVIHGCYLEKTGALRILVGANKQCSSNERAIDWNREGPPGPAGPPGGQHPSSWPSPRLPTSSLQVVTLLSETLRVTTAAAAAKSWSHSPAKSSQPARYLSKIAPQTQFVSAA